MNLREDILTHKKQVADKGFTIINKVFNSDEIDALINIINSFNTSSPAFRQTSDLFAIRRFLKEIDGAASCIFTPGLTNMIKELFGEGYRVVKSIYFDKPAASNWFVAWHQDLTISVDRKAEVEGFVNWTNKQGQFAVQPPVAILEDNFTMRIHLDDTDEQNGALRVIPGSHANGICRYEAVDGNDESVYTCTVNKGGIMIMRPLLMHSSGRTVNDSKRRVVHIEFSKATLPPPLQWSEAMQVCGYM